MDVSGTKGQTFSPGSYHRSGLKALSPGPWIHPGLKMGSVFTARQNSLYSRAVDAPGTKGQTFSPGSNHHPELKDL